MAVPAVTYWPHKGVYVKGQAKKWTDGSMQLVASARPRRPRLDMYGRQVTRARVDMRMLDASMRHSAALVAANRERLMTSPLSAADYIANKDNLDHLILVRLYNKLMGDQQKWFYLDEMFTTIQMDKLTLRMPFRDNPAAAQFVGRHERYDITEVAYDEVVFNLRKLVTSYSVPIEDPLRAMISPIPRSSRPTTLPTSTAANSRQRRPL